jgi:hypothetical protein
LRVLVVVDSGVVVEVVVVDCGLVVDVAFEAGAWVDGGAFGTVLDGWSAPPSESSPSFSSFAAWSLLPWLVLA